MGSLLLNPCLHGTFVCAIRASSFTGWMNLGPKPGWRVVNPMAGTFATCLLLLTISLGKSFKNSYLALFRTLDIKVHTRRMPPNPQQISPGLQRGNTIKHDDILCSKWIWRHHNETPRNGQPISYSALTYSECETDNPSRPGLARGTHLRHNFTDKPPMVLLKLWVFADNLGTLYITHAPSRLLVSSFKHHFGRRLDFGVFSGLFWRSYYGTNNYAQKTCPTSQRTSFGMSLESPCKCFFTPAFPILGVSTIECKTLSYYYTVDPLVD